MEAEPSDDWEDLDEESLGSQDSFWQSEEEAEPELSEREKRIKKGQLAKEAARQRENLDGTSMPGNGVPGAREAPQTQSQRRTSVGRAAKEQSPSQGPGLRKRKLSIDPDPNKKGKASSGEAMSTPSSTEDGIGDLKLSLIHI